MKCICHCTYHTHTKSVFPCAVYAYISYVNEYKKLSHRHVSMVVRQLLSLPIAGPPYTETDSSDCPWLGITK